MRAARTDRNHSEVAAALRRVGAFVVDVHMVGGALDLVVAYRGVVRFLEVKDGSKPPSARKLTEAEVETVAQLLAVGAPVHIVVSVDDALRAIGAITLEGEELQRGQ